MQPNKLKSKIVEAGYGQRRLASEMGMSPTTLNAKINGRSDFDAEEIIMLCKILGIVDNNEKCNIFLS